MFLGVSRSFVRLSEFDTLVRGIASEGDYMRINGQGLSVSIAHEG